MEPHPFSWTGKDVEAELVMRVMIKVWNEGERGFYGGYMVDGKVLLHVPNTVYFRYREKQTMMAPLFRFVLSLLIRMSSCRQCQVRALFTLMMQR